MDAEAILADVRELLDDKVEPYLYSDAVLIGHLNAACAEYCLRTGTIQDSTSEVTVLDLVADQASYPLDPAIYRVRRVRLAGQRDALTLLNARQLDEAYPGWDDVTLSSSGTPRYVVFDLDQGSLTLYPRPASTGTLNLSVWRRPLERELIEDLADEPAIIEHGHRELKHWVLYEAFSMKDSEEYDPKRAEQHYNLFEARVGTRPDMHALQLVATSRIRGVKAHFD